MNEFSMLRLQCTVRTQMRYEDIYDGLEVYSKPATAESELYAQLKAFNILNILHNQIRFVNFNLSIITLLAFNNYTWRRIIVSGFIQTIIGA